MSQEYLEKLFSQSYSIYAKLHNRNQSADYSISTASVERTESAYSFNSEASIPISDKIKFFENGNDVKVKDINDISIYDSILEDINSLVSDFKSVCSLASSSDVVGSLISTMEVVVS